MPTAQHDSENNESTQEISPVSEKAYSRKSEAKILAEQDSSSQDKTPSVSHKEVEVSSIIAHDDSDHKVGVSSIISRGESSDKIDTAVFRGVDERKGQLREELRNWQDSVLLTREKSRFSLRELIGVGGQGLVFSLFDNDCEREIAVKVLRGERQNENQIARFIHEAQVTAQLEHPGIIPIYELNVLEDGTIFYTMKRIGGRTLFALIRERGGKQEHRFDLLRSFTSICDTMGFAHVRGVVHRDLKPSNIMIGDFGEVLVLDWGLSKILDQADICSIRGSAGSRGGGSSDALITRVGNAVGTPAYMSPEQAEGENDRITQASDCYALGLILFEIIVGQSDYTSSDADTIMALCVSGHRKQVLDHAPDTPRQLVAIIDKCLEQEPEYRYQNAADIGSDIRRFLAGEAVTAYNENPFEVFVRKAYQHKATVLVGMSVFLIGALLVGTWMSINMISERQQIDTWYKEAADLRSAGLYTDAADIYTKILTVSENEIDAERGRLQVEQQLERNRQQREAQQEEEVRNDEYAKRLTDADALMKNLPSADTFNDVAAITIALQNVQRAQALVPDLALLVDTILFEQSAALTKLIEKSFADLIRREEQLRRRDAQEIETAKRLEKFEEVKIQLEEKFLALRRAQQNIMKDAQDDDIVSYMQSLEEVSGLINVGQEFTDNAEQRQQLFQFEESRLQLQDFIVRTRDNKERAKELALLFERGNELTKKEILTSDDTVLSQSLVTQLLELDAQHPRRQEMMNQRDRILTRYKDQEVTKLLEQNKVYLKQVDVLLSELQVHKDRLSQLQAQQASIAGESNDGHEVFRSLFREGQGIKQKNQAIASLLGVVEELYNEARVIDPNHEALRISLVEFYRLRVELADNEGDAVTGLVYAERGQTVDKNKKYELLFANKVLVKNESSQRTVMLRRIVEQEDRTFSPSGDSQSLLAGGSEALPSGRYEIQWSHGVREARVLTRGKTFALKDPLNPNLPQGTLFIPEGVVQDARGQIITVNRFALTQYEITNAEYFEFLNDPRSRKYFTGTTPLYPRRTAGARESLWVRRSNGRFELVQRENGERVNPRAPVSGISFRDAEQYIRYRREVDGLFWRFPTREEWMLAAQSGDLRQFTWGDYPVPGYAYAYDNADNKQLKRDTRENVMMASLAVGSFERDRNVQGVYDLAGSVAEFVDGSLPGLTGVLYCGGSWTDFQIERFSSTSVRAAPPEYVYPSIGFRLALSVE